MSSRSEKTIRQIRQILQSSQDFERSERELSQNSPFSCYLTPRANLYNQYPLRTPLTRKSPKKSPKKRKTRKNLSDFNSRPFLFNNSNRIYHQLSNSAKKAFLPGYNLQSTSVQTSLGLILDQSDSDPITAKQNEIMSFINIGDNLILKRFFNRWRQRWFFKTAYNVHKLIQTKGSHSIKRQLRRTAHTNDSQFREGREMINYDSRRKEEYNDQNQHKSRRHHRNHTNLVAKRNSIPTTVKNRLIQTQIQNRNVYNDENGYNSIFDFDDEYEYYEYDDNDDTRQNCHAYHHMHTQTRTDSFIEDKSDGYEYENNRKNDKISDRNKLSQKVHQSSRQKMSKTAQNRRHQSVDQNNRRSTSNIDYRHHNSVNNDDDEYDDFSMQNDRSNRNSKIKSQLKDDQNLSDYSSTSLLVNPMEQIKKSRRESARKDSYFAQTSTTNNRHNSRRNSPSKNNQNDELTENQNYSDFSNALTFGNSKQRTNKANNSSKDARRSSPPKNKSTRKTNSNQNLSFDASNDSYDDSLLHFDLPKTSKGTRNNSSIIPSKENRQNEQQKQMKNSPIKGQFNNNTKELLNMSESSNLSIDDIDTNLQQSKQSKSNSKRDSLIATKDNHHSSRSLTSKNQINVDTRLDQNNYFDYSEGSFEDNLTQSKQSKTSKTATRKDTEKSHHSHRNSLTSNKQNINIQINHNYSDYSNASFNDNSIHTSSKTTKNSLSQNQNIESHKQSQKQYKISNKNYSQENINLSDKMNQSDEENNYNYSKTENDTNKFNSKSQNEKSKINTTEVNSKTFSPIKTPANFDDIVSQIIPDLDEFIEKYHPRSSRWSLENESDAEFKTIVEKSRFYQQKYSHISLDDYRGELIPVNTDLTYISSLMNKKYDSSLPELHEFDHDMTQGNIPPPLYLNK